MNDYEKILEIGRNNHNVFQTEAIVAAGIRKEKIKHLLEAGKIQRISRGNYVVCNSFSDRYYEFQSCYPKSIYSYSSAAYIWGLLDQPEIFLECTFPRGYNASSMKTRYEIKRHFTTKEFYEMGVKEVTSPFGNPITVYDKERTVCDYIKHKYRCEIRVWGTVLNNYFKRRDKDLKNLIRYAKEFQILDELEMYVELLQ